MKRKSFVLYRSVFDGIMDLPKSRRWTIFEAICRYGLDGEEPRLSGAEMAFFRQVMASVDSNNERYVNGKKGGRPRSEKPVVSDEKTSGFDSENQPIYDVDVDVDVDVEGTLSGKPDALSPPQELIRYLNLTAHRAYQFTDTNLRLAGAILERYPMDVAKAVVDNKVAMWGDDRKMMGYLRPRTLFDPDNFEAYLNEPDVTEEGDVV